MCNSIRALVSQRAVFIAGFSPPDRRLIKAERTGGGLTRLRRRSFLSCSLDTNSCPDRGSARRTTQTFMEDSMVPTKSCGHHNLSFLLFFPDKSGSGALRLVFHHHCNRLPIGRHGHVSHRYNLSVLFAGLIDRAFVHLVQRYRGAGGSALDWIILAVKFCIKRLSDWTRLDQAIGCALKCNRKCGAQIAISGARSAQRRNAYPAARNFRCGRPHTVFGFRFRHDIRQANGIGHKLFL